MKIVDAAWEKRNLGVSCYEINVEKEDSFSLLTDVLENYKADYMVVKLPAGMVEHSFFLQDHGFYFIETMTLCQYNLQRPINLSPLQQRMVSDFTYQEMKEEDLQELFEEIKKGMFHTDRVALDPFFTSDQSTNRYIGWIKDELQHQSSIYKVENKKGQSVGFFGYKEVRKDTGCSFLGGLYTAKKNLGLGTNLHYYAWQEGKKRGHKRFDALFSSNNRGATVVSMSLGYMLEEQYYVFVKHGKTETSD